MNLTNKIPFIAVVFAALLSSCIADPKKPGRVFMPDMHYSNAYETYATTRNPNFSIKADSITWRMPANNTIPRGSIPMEEKIRENESYLMSYTMFNHMDMSKENQTANYEYAGEHFVNPIPLTRRVLESAAINYNRFCAVCHGQQGAGDGPIVVRPDGSDGPYTAIPPAYEVRLPTINDGQMFYSISQGKGMMGPYGPQLTVTERWDLVHYIKDLVNLYTDTDFQDEEIKVETAAADATLEADTIETGVNPPVEEAASQRETESH